MQQVTTQLGRPLVPKTGIAVRVIAEQRYLTHLQPAGMLQALRARFEDVTLYNADAMAVATHEEIFSASDVVIGRGRSWPVFALLRAAELAGATVINSAAAIASVYDKARMTIEFSAAGIPTPETWIGAPEQIARQVRATSFPLVVKPVNGDNGSGISLISSIQQLRSLGAAPILAQRYIANDGFDVKLYCIGERVFAVRKPCSVAALHGTRMHTSALVPVTSDLIEIAARCRVCFGLELFGVDCLLTANGPVVIEVNEFPNYSAVPNANELLADYVCERASARC